MSTRVIISASYWRDYSFSMPLGALLWREIVGFEPFLLVVGDWQREARTRLCYDFIKANKFDHFCIPEIEPYEVSTVSQNSRQHACVLDAFSDHEWLLLSDADLWPLKETFYHQHEITDKVCALYYSNGDHYQILEGFTGYPTCHMTMRAGTWREIMGLKKNNDLHGQLKNTLDTWLKPRMAGKKPSDASWQAWMSDQWYASKRISEAPWHGTDRVLNIERAGHPPTDRLDRGNWSSAPDLGPYTDTHVPKAPDQLPQWQGCRHILSQLMPHHMNMIDEFRDAHVRSYGSL